MKATFARIFLKDLVDFTIVFVITILLTIALYFLLPSFTRIDLSFYFFEQNLELFFLNPELLLWLLGMGFGVTIIYFMFGVMLHRSTFGGALMRIKLVDKTTKKSATIMQAILMALGAYIGVLAFLVGPMYAWWLDAETRGLAEKWSSTKFLMK